MEPQSLISPLSLRLARMAQRFQELLLTEDFDLAELQAALIAMLWGVWLVFFGDYTLVRVLQGPSTGKVRAVVTAGTIIFGLGFLQLRALLMRNFQMRRVTAMAAMIIWAFFSMTVFFQYPSLLLGPTALAFSIGSIWGYLRLGLRGR